MPFVKVACSDRFYRLGGGDDGEVEGVHRRASKFIGLLREGVVSTFCINGTVPDEGSAGGFGHCGVCRGADGEMQDDERVATSGVGSVEGVNGACVVDAVMPYSGVAGIDKIFELGGLEDGEVESVCAGTVVAVCIFMPVGAGSGIIYAMPFKAVADGLGLGVVGTLQDSEVEGNGGVAAYGVQSVERGGGTCEVGGAVPFD